MAFEKGNVGSQSEMISPINAEKGKVMPVGGDTNPVPVGQVPDPLSLIPPGSGKKGK